ncbi:polyprenyl synthetase family protein [Streptomyces alanosinicus]|uniref:Geranylgeranyl pyrophosphate synthase n=1 Tax=Streptomyces alanosinicus TaxID=68171 RepID=A0A919D5B4_9ACTN|nr:polyprenyl synthetase family protein [Streptomyces alanosinicus]GHE09732.1 geranylgeranyl pyrophosphate synthase [Streptomyces alanosinicus]
MVDARLDDFQAAKERTAAAQGLPAELSRALGDFLAAGGKRLRPLLCVLGWHTAGRARGQAPAPVVQVAASLEMFHAFCLIHDDIMDDSATRRGRPTVHRALAALHQGRAGRGAADRLGTSAAILVGDLALAWADELLHTADLTSAQLTAVLPLVDAMRTEVVYGQYLDLLTTGHTGEDVEVALRIARYKTATYTCERPLQVGAALAGASAAVRSALSAYALPIGEAFQLRDDILGAFGDPAATGKSSWEDLRDGKHTVLMALALQRADAVQREALHTLVGDPALSEEGAARIRDILTATGALQAVEGMIAHRRARAQHALEQAPFPPAATAALRQLADATTTRTT